MVDKRRILFVCTGNTCRSPMAAALFNKLNSKAGWQAESAGIAAFGGDPPTGLAEDVMCEKYEVDLTGHRSRPVSCLMVEQATWVLAMTPSQCKMLRDACPEFADKILTIGQMAGEPDVAINDPFGLDHDAYLSTARALERLIEKIIEKIG